jgi:hypothetical protein
LDRELLDKVLTEALEQTGLVAVVVVLGQLGRPPLLVLTLEWVGLELVPQLLDSECFTLVVVAAEIIGIMLAMGRQIQAV